MIVVRLTGGLGNQMFQYAMARSLADRHDASLKLDVNDFVHHPLRSYELDKLNIRAEVASKQDIELFRVSANRFSLGQRIKRSLLSFTPKTVFREDAFTYDNRIHEVTPPVYLDGYWQSDQYFVHNAAAIRNDFSLNRSPDALNGEILERIKNVNAVSLHVRRGDYVSNIKTSRHHAVCSLEYYHNAVAYVTARISKPHLFIFSDDHEWTRDSILLECPTTFVTVNSDKYGVFDMMLMKHCRHHIIANSTFSWWGAWLNPSPNKIVVAPRYWFNTLVHDTRDLIPPSWVTM